MVRYQRLQFYRGSFSMKMVDERVQDTKGCNFIGVFRGLPKFSHYKKLTESKWIELA